MNRALSATPVCPVMTLCVLVPPTGRLVPCRWPSPLSNAYESAPWRTGRSTPIDGISTEAMIPSPKSSRLWYSLSSLNPKSPSMTSSSVEVSPMTCGVAASFLLYARACSTMRAYFTAERSPSSANAALCAALRAAPACSTPIHANVPTPTRQNMVVTAASRRNTRAICRFRSSRDRRSRRVSYTCSPLMTQSQSIRLAETLMSTPPEEQRISAGKRERHPAGPKSMGSFRMPSLIWRGSSVTARHACDE